MGGRRSNRRWILLAVLLGLLGGGVIAYVATRDSGGDTDDKKRGKGIATDGKSGGKSDGKPGGTSDGTAGAGAGLDNADIEREAARHAAATRACYTRAIRDASADGIKKLGFSLAISPDGFVTDVQLSTLEHADSPLARCLIATIRSWKFPRSRGGTYPLTLHFG